MKKIITALLAAAQLAALCACGGTSDTATDSVSDTIESEQKSYYEALNIPDFESDTLTILCRSEVTDEIYAEENTGEAIDNAVYKRNSTVSEQLDIEIECLDIPGWWSDRTTFMNFVTSGIMAGDDEFQVIAGYMCYMAPTITEGQYVDLSTLPGVDLTQPWWTQGFNDNITINNKLYMAVGDMCTTRLRYSRAVFVNLEILDQYGYKSSELYDAVRNGEWTFDYMSGIAKNVAQDTNRNNMIDRDDLLGAGFPDMSLRALTNAFCIDYTSRDEDGMPVLAMWGERFVNGYEKVYNACQTEWFSVGGDLEETMSYFAEGKRLFFSTYLDEADLLRDMKSDYGILPMPKLNKEQENYRTEVSDPVSILLVPTTVKDPEMVGYALECLNYESRNLVVPAYFETTLESKLTRDEESIEMLGIIRDTSYFDFGYIFCTSIGGGINSMMSKAINNPDVSSLWAANEPTMKAGLESLLTFFRSDT